MNMGFTGTLISIVGMLVCLATFFFAFRMTRDKPTGRVAALIGAVSLSLLTTFVVYNLNRSLEGQAARSTQQLR